MNRLLCTVMVAALCGSAANARDTIPIPFAKKDETAQISVEVLPSKLRMSSLPRSLRDARKRMHAGEALTADEYRALANRGDGLAALRLTRILSGEGIEANASDVAYFGLIAVGTGRIWPLEDAVHAMSFLNPETEPRTRVSKYIQVLYPHAWAGNQLALDAVIKHNGEGRLFGPLSEKTAEKITAASGHTIGETQKLRKVMDMLYAVDLSEGDRVIANQMIDELRQSNSFRMRTIAGNLATLVPMRSGGQSAGIYGTTTPASTAMLTAMANDANVLAPGGASVINTLIPAGPSDIVDLIPTEPSAEGIIAMETAASAPVEGQIVVLNATQVALQSMPAPTTGDGAINLGISSANAGPAIVSLGIGEPADAAIAVTSAIVTQITTPGVEPDNQHATVIPPMRPLTNQKGDPLPSQMQQFLQELANK